MSLIKKIAVLSILVLTSFNWPLICRAEVFFNPNSIISDHDLTDYQSMTLEEIQKFLENAGGTLDTYQCTDIDGRKKLASEIIYRAAQEYKVNPQIIITVLQKEQTLVSQPPKKSSQYDWATGFGCYDYRKPVQRFSGFATQVDRAAWRLRYFLEHPWEFFYRAGQTYKISRQKVSPQNSATAALYNYTPYVTGNKLFWSIWQKWFVKKTESKFADGTLLKAKGDNGVWLIQNNQRRPFYSKTVFLLNHSFKNVREVSIEELKSFEIGEPMTFPNYSLVEASSGEIFMLIDGAKRSISEKIFKAIGFNPEEIIKVETNDLTTYKYGAPIRTPYPSGALLQDKASKSVYYVEEDIKYPIVDQSILDVNFPYFHIVKAESKYLSEFKNGEPVKFRDGTLVKTTNEPNVYLITQGQRMPIPSEEIFDALGYQWSAILIIPETVLFMYPLGEPLKI
ncbi:MAG: hypothetical protein WC499_00140 [Patescibacteria group bacterium]